MTGVIFQHLANKCNAVQVLFVFARAVLWGVIQAGADDLVTSTKGFRLII